MDSDCKEEWTLYYQTNVMTITGNKNCLQDINYVE